MTDFAITDHGTVWRIEAVSDEARAFAEENLRVEDWMGLPTDFLTDWRPARELAAALEAEGFNVGATR